MDLQDIWHNHKVFIRNVGGGAAVYLLLMWYTIHVSDQAQALAQKNDQLQKRYRGMEQQLRNVEGLEKGRSAALEESVEPKVLGAVLWSLPAERAVAKDAANRYLAFAGKRRQASFAIKSAAEERNVPIPADLGFLNESNDALVDEHLVRLHVTERLIVALIKAGAGRIASVAQAEATARRLPFAAEEQAKFLQRIPVRVECLISPEKVSAVLTEFQKRESFLEISEYELERESRSKTGEVKLTLTMTATILRDEIGEGEADAPSIERRPAGTRRPGQLLKFGQKRNR